MSQHPSAPVGSRVLVALLALALLAGAACSSSDDATLPDGVAIVTLPPPTDGANCTDPTGDIGDTAKEIAGALSEPAGIDIVRARADVSDTEMVVTYTMAGPVAAVAKPTFYLSQGVSGQEASFELRAEPTATNGPWSVDLITWDRNERGGLTESPRRPLAAPVTVTDDELTYTVSLTEIPKIVTLVWQFGASAELPPEGTATNPRIVLDDCNNMIDQASAGSSVPTTAPVPTTVPPSGPVGADLVHRNGATVTVSAVQKPPANLRPLTIPPAPDFEPAVVEAQICAGEEQLAIRQGNFRVLTTENELWGYWDADQSATEPAFPEPMILQPGDCRKGWVTYEIPIEAAIQSIVYSPDNDNEHYLIWDL